MFEELFLIKNLYPEDQITVITTNPDNHPRLNRQAFECILNNFSYKFINNHSFLSNRNEEPYADNLIKFGDGYLYQKDPCGLRRSFLKEFSKNKKKIYFKLYDDQKQAGEFIRENLGIPIDSKYVTLHVRESGYLPNLEYHSYRDCNINNCLKTIKHLINNGYHVIRLGDPTMTKLDFQSSKYIDLAHSKFTHTLAEIYFISQADFHIGTGSGVFVIAQTCGIPIIYLNTEIPFCAWGTEYDIDLPRIFYSQTLNRKMSIPELAISDIMTFSETNQYKSSGVKLIENNEDIVLQTTQEMIKNIYKNNIGSNINGSYFSTIKNLYYEMGERNIHFSYPYVQKKKIAESYLKNNPEFLGVTF